MDSFEKLNNFGNLIFFKNEIFCIFHNSSNCKIDNRKISKNLKLRKFDNFEILNKFGDLIIFKI